MNKLLIATLTGMLVINSYTPTFANSLVDKTHMEISQIQTIKKTIENNVKISTKELKESNDLINVDIKIPVISLLNNKDIETKLNKEIEKEILDLKEDIKKSALKSKEEGTLMNPYGLSVNYEVHYNKNNLLSLTISYYSYTGGAHGMSSKKTFNIDTKTGINASLKDLFNPGEDYKEIINTVIREKIQENPSEYYEEISRYFKGILQDQPFYIVEDNIVIYFEPYEIAPYAGGFKEFKMPFKSFEKGVNLDLQLKEGNPVIYTDLIKEYETGFKGDIRVPVINGLKDKNIQENLNKLLRNDALKFNNSLKKAGTDFVEESKKMGFNIIDYAADTDYTIYLANDKLLSLTVLYYQYTGGAHGNYTVTPYNIDLTTGKELYLKDIFKNGVDYKKVINTEINKQIKEKNKENYPIAGFDGIKEDQNFYIEKDRLVIYFQPYEIAPYALGVVKFEIPFSLIKNYINI
ncbi:DUF4163 domain-containing protein [Clostridium sp. MSJ-11]|uniref:DUF4163 domain-containing protein n=1 Tax=Clostridium mobile TaxID=2841512 RepID=A0ABS6EFU4_9CLOT|nr:DUF4163 domain-containing protein [Clostridium mobile]MBU5483581.1 DUF4163 domain-containing protein [Clostridium mobile]